jgi:hypothetical protein
VLVSYEGYVLGLISPGGRKDPKWRAPSS